MQNRRTDECKRETTKQRVQKYPDTGAVSLSKHAEAVYGLRPSHTRTFRKILNWRVKSFQKEKSQRQVKIKESYSNILAIDLGSKVTATVCGSFDNKPIFLGREVRGIRRHYQYLRTQLGRKKLLKKIRKQERQKLPACG